MSVKSNLVPFSTDPEIFARDRQNGFRGSFGGFAGWPNRIIGYVPARVELLPLKCTFIPFLHTDHILLAKWLRHERPWPVWFQFESDLSVLNCFFYLPFYLLFFWYTFYFLIGARTISGTHREHLCSGLSNTPKAYRNDGISTQKWFPSGM